MVSTFTGEGDGHSTSYTLETVAACCHATTKVLKEYQVMLQSTRDLIKTSQRALEASEQNLAKSEEARRKTEQKFRKFADDTFAYLAEWREEYNEDDEYDGSLDDQQTPPLNAQVA